MTSLLRFPGLAVALLLGCAPTDSAGPFEPCTASLRCPEGLSCRAATTTASAMLCTRTCATISDCPLPSSAGAARVCATLAGQPSGLCLAFCARDADCLPGTVCRALPTAAGDTARVCVP